MAISAFLQGILEYLGPFADFDTFLTTPAKVSSLNTGFPVLVNDLSHCTGFPVLENDSMIDWYPRTGFLVQDNESIFINAGTVLATEHRLPTAC